MSQRIPARNVRVTTHVTWDNYHLRGGLRASLTEQRGVHIWPVRTINGVLQFEDVERESLHGFVKSLGSRLIGREQVYESDTMPSVWQTIERRPTSHDRIHTPELWGLVSQGYRQRLVPESDKERLAVEAIRFHLLATQYRLRDLSISYHKALQREIAGGNLGDGEFSSLGDFDLLLAVFAFFAGAGTLRDHLARIYSLKVLDKDYDAMARLIEHLRHSSDLSPFQLRLVELHGSDPSAWMRALSRLRNRFVHHVDVGRDFFRGRLFRRQVLLGDEVATTISLPLIVDDKFQADALEICAWINGNMLELARQIIFQCELKIPEPITYTTDRI